jgi:hypothetical protein
LTLPFSLQRQPWAAGVLFSIQGIVNLLTTSQVVFRKYVPSKFSARGVGQLLKSSQSATKSE